MDIDVLIPKNILCSKDELSCGIKASNDLEAIQAWLNEYRKNQNTYASYKKEARKFRLYFKQEHNNLLKKLKKEDFEQYITWLQYPPKKWFKAKNNSKALFNAKQNFTAIRYNIRVINSLLNYLVEADYIRKNPLKLIKKLDSFALPDNRALEVKARILEDEEFAAVIATLEELPEVNKKACDFKARAKLIFALLYHLGLRVNELATARWDNFKLVQGRCWFYLIGKGGKPGQIPVNDELLIIIKKYRIYHNKPDNINLFEDSYILESKADKHLSTRRIREIVKEIFTLAANKFTDKRVQEKLKNASPHDLRHLLASDLDKLGLSIIDTKEILRHSSEKTTEIYRNSKESKRHVVIQSNTVGMDNLLNQENKSFTLSLTVACRKDTILGFSYFIDTVVNIYLKKYKIIKMKELETIKDEFAERAKVYQKLNIDFILADEINSKELVYLRGIISNAANARGIEISLLVK